MAWCVWEYWPGNCRGTIVIQDREHAKINYIHYIYYYCILQDHEHAKIKISTLQRQVDKLANAPPQPKASQTGTGATPAPGEDEGAALLCTAIRPLSTTFTIIMG